MKLDKEEKALLKDYEKDEFSSISNLKKEIARCKEYSKHALQKNKRINIRISERDLMRIKKKAVEEGMPYQTLISSMIHKFASGKLVNHEDIYRDRTAVKR
jgi:predicted DNA binding CopG/RHH family protein